MRACLKLNRLPYLLAGALLCVYMGLVPAQPSDAQAEAPRFIIHSAATRLVNDVYVLNAEIEYQFSAAVLEALENGVPLTLELTIEVIHPRAWLWNEQFTDLKQRYRLQYHALTQQYLVRNLNSDTQYNFPTRSAALHALGNVADLPLLDKRLLQADQPYTARLRAGLDIETLPTPLRLLAYLSPQWHLDSAWYTWSLQS